jgi:hypothetical protein
MRRREGQEGLEEAGQKWGEEAEQEGIEEEGQEGLKDKGKEWVEEERQEGLEGKGQEWIEKGLYMYVQLLISEGGKLGVMRKNCRKE